jgi:hypothetical protein
MALLIDGYNLLHATDIFGDGTGPTPLHSSREALLRFMEAALSPRELSETTIVFDAAEAPPGLPQTTSHAGMTVRFARRYPHADADTLLEELIEQAQAPGSLLVVSSDHRVQRAARQGGAQSVDSEVWYREQVANLKNKSGLPRAGEFRKPTSVSDADVAFWTAQFNNAAEDLPKPMDEEIFPEGYGDDVLGEFDNLP